MGNLVANALRHSGSPEIHVAARASSERTFVTLWVRDLGRGIPAAQQGRIFEKFASLPRSPTDEPSRDTGLGLPFCKLAVQEMGGKLTLESATGTGSTFSVRLPVHRRD
jgi:signal transduction histidine kinase